jgi:hypothetical protein
MSFIGWLTNDFNVKARKNERKGPKGCLRKSIHFNGSTINEIVSDVCENIVASEKIAPNGCKFVSLEIYNAADWKNNPLTARPIKTVAFEEIFA